MKSAFAAYIRAVPTYRLVYGAFASVPIFLLWIYVVWVVVLLGAVITLDRDKVKNYILTTG
jgi:membrane protein